MMSLTACRRFRPFSRLIVVRMLSSMLSLTSPISGYLIVDQIDFIYEVIKRSAGLKDSTNIKRP